MEDCSGDSESENMRQAFTAIAQEIERFRSTCSSEDDVREDPCKNKLKIRKQQVKTLKDNLKTACMVAKTVINAKKNEIATLSNNLDNALHESKHIIQKNSEMIEIVTKLKTENAVLKDRFEQLVGFIQLGYQELQKMREEAVEDLPVSSQLKEILVSCGKYYADYCNAQERCTQLEQKNRFLSNKLNITESSLYNVTEELKAHKEMCYQSKSIKYRDKNGHACSKNHSAKRLSNASKVSIQNHEGDVGSFATKELSTTESAPLDLTSHLSLVKGLLNDQDNMLRDLKKLSDEFVQA